MAGRRRLNGMGSVTQLRDGRWQARVTVGPETGQSPRRVVFYGKTRRQAEDWLAEAVRARALGGGAALGRAPNFAAYVEGWLAGIGVRVRPRTADRYRQLLTAHAVPALGRFPITALQVSHVNHLVASKRAAGLAPATVAGLRTAIRSVLASALKEGLVTRNVGALADAPHIPDRAPTILSPADTQRLLATGERDRDWPVWALALATGMRQGELLGLKWSDYEADRRRLHVERVLQRLGGEWLFPPPKTLRSRRVLSCSSLAVKALERQRRVQAEDRLRAGAAWEDRWGDLIFTGPTGKPRQSAAVTHHLVKHLQAVGLPRVRFHDLRHAAASYLADAGLSPRAVADYLGDSIVTTMKVYTHTLPDSNRRAADMLAAVLTGTAPSG